MSKTASKEAAAATLTTVGAQSAPKSAPEERPSLPCALEDFFLLTTMSWENCLADLDKFAGISDRYTETFVNEQITLIRNTEQLPNNETRVSEYAIAEPLLMQDLQEAVNKVITPGNGELVH